MQKYKAILSDIDGTLTAVSVNALPSPKVSQAIEKAKREGIIFGLATGRPYFIIEYLTKHLNLSSPMIVDNGAAIIDSGTGSILWEVALTHEEAMGVLSLTKNCELTRVSDGVGNLVNPTYIPLNKKIRKISVHGLNPGEAERLINKLEIRFKDLAIVRAAAFEGKEFLDVYISHAQATKQHSVLKFAEILGITTKEIIGIGDHYNDFSLLAACGLKVAMGNAVKDLKEIADYIAPSVEEDGVEDVINKFVLGIK